MQFEFTVNILLLYETSREQFSENWRASREHGHHGRYQVKVISSTGRLYVVYKVPNFSLKVTVEYRLAIRVLMGFVMAPKITYKLPIYINGSPANCTNSVNDYYKLPIYMNGSPADCTNSVNDYYMTKRKSTSYLSVTLKRIPGSDLTRIHVTLGPALYTGKRLK